MDLLFDSKEEAYEKIDCVVGGAMCSSSDEPHDAAPLKGGTMVHQLRVYGAVRSLHPGSWSER